MNKKRPNCGMIKVLKSSDNPHTPHQTPASFRKPSRQPYEAPDYTYYHPAGIGTIQSSVTSKFVEITTCFQILQRESVDK